MHFLLVCALIALYGWLSLHWLPFLLVVAGGFLLAYLLLESVVTAGAPAMSTRRKLMLATWADQTEAQVYGIINVNADPLIAYLDGLAAKGDKVTVTTACLKAVAMAMKEAPSLNSRIAFGHFLPRPSVDVSCLVSLDDGADLAIAKVSNCDRKTLVELHGDVRAKAEKLRKHKDKDFEASKPLMAMLPVWVLTPLVSIIGYLAGALGLNIPALGVRPFPFGSVMVSSVGMLGVEQAFIPFTPFARVPFLLMVGECAPRAVVAEDKKTIKVQNVLTLTGTLDHRFADGTEAARLAKRIKYVLEHPEECMNDTTPMPTQAEREAIKRTAKEAKAAAAKADKAQ